MKWIFIGGLVFIVSCAEPSREVTTKIIHEVDTVYVEVAKDEVFPWELSCADSADTQTDMNICAGKCYEIADSSTAGLFEEILFDLKDQIQTEANLLQRERLFAIHNSFIEIRELAADYIEGELGGGTMLPLLRLCTKTWIAEFEYKLLRGISSNVLEG